MRTAPVRPGPMRLAVIGWLALVAFLGARGVAPAQEAGSSRPPADPETGRRLYDAKCGVCHGREGDGDGPAARYLSPPARDFTQAEYKFRSTPSGELPTDADLFETIGRGLPGTAMFAWRGLSDSDRWLLVDHLKAFSGRFQSESPSGVLVAGEPPAPTLARIEQGGRLYRELGCARCHGADGRGGGNAVSALRDDDGQRIAPGDLTRGENYRGGASAGAIFRTLLTGLNGTPMPSYEGAMTEDEAWSLAHFIRSLFVGISEPIDRTGAR